MKLTINYDPINGEVEPDGKIASYVKHLACIAEVRSSLEITVGSALIIDEIRALIIEGTLSHKDIVFKFKGEEIHPSKDGTISYWPKGFCDVYDNILERLLGNKQVITTKP